MERQLVTSRKLQREEKREEKLPVDKEEYRARKYVSDIDSEEEVDKSCLTEEEDGDYLSDHNSQRRTREAVTTRYDDTSSYDYEWLFGNVKYQQKKLAIKDDVEDMNFTLEISSGVLVSFPRAQVFSQVGIFSLPYTVMF